MGNLEKLRTCSERLGNLCLSTFEGRKILQKEIYFLQEFGVDLGYSFNFYIYGPYSSELTHDAFFLESQIEQAPYTVETADLSSEEEAALEQARTFLSEVREQDGERAYWLELLSSLHFLWNHSYVINRNRDTVLSMLQGKKAIQNIEDLNTAWERLTRHNLIEV